MKDTHINSGNGADELDLIVLVEKLVFFIRRFFMILAGFTVIGVLAALFMFLSTPRKYTSELVLHSFVLTNLENIQIIENWKDLLKKKEYSTLAGIWNCTPDIPKKVTKMSAEEIQKLYIQNNPHGFIVQVTVKDTSMLDKLQQGIVYGLENTEYVKERLVTKRGNLVELIEKVKGEIIKLDSTKLAVENILNNKNKSSSSLFVDITSINSGIISLNEKLLAYKEELKFANAIQVLQRFNKFSMPESRQGPLLFIAGAIIGLLIGYLVSLFISVRQKLIERSKV
jgi:hypothetical protein